MKGNEKSVSTLHSLLADELTVIPQPIHQYMICSEMCST